MMRLILLIALSQAQPRDSVVYLLSPASDFQVTTGKSGLFGFLGHEHTIRARAFSGRIVYHPDSVAAARVEITVRADSLEALTPPSCVPAAVRAILEARAA